MKDNLTLYGEKTWSYATFNSKCSMNLLGKNDLIAVVSKTEEIKGRC